MPTLVSFFLNGFSFFDQIKLFRSFFLSPSVQLSFQKSFDYMYSYLKCLFVLSLPVLGLLCRNSSNCFVNLVSSTVLTYSWNSFLRFIISECKLLDCSISLLHPNLSVFMSVLPNIFLSLFWICLTSIFLNKTELSAHCVIVTGFFI